MSGFIKLMKTIIPLAIILLFTYQSSKKYLKILQQGNLGSSSNIKNCYFFSFNFNVLANIINYYYDRNPLIKLPFSNFVISYFIRSFKECREKPQDLNIYYFYYLIIFDTCIFIFILQFIKGNYWKGIIKAGLRIIKFFFDGKDFMFLRKNGYYEKKYSTNSEVINLKSEIIIDIIFISLDIIYIFIKYQDSKNKTINIPFDNEDESEDNGSLDFKQFPKPQEKNGKEEDDDDNDIKNNNDKWGD